MAYEIVWLPKAEMTFEGIISWLQTNWTDREISNFVARTNVVLDMIRINPKLYRGAGKRKIREVVINKQIILLYRIKSNKVELLTFFDTRQNPNKKFK